MRVWRVGLVTFGRGTGNMRPGREISEIANVVLWSDLYHGGSD